MGLEEWIVDQGWAYIIAAFIGVAGTIGVQILAKHGVEGILGKHQVTSTDEHTRLSKQLTSSNASLTEKLTSSNASLTEKLTSSNASLTEKLTNSNASLTDKIHAVHTIVVTDKEVSEKNYQSLDEKQKDIKDSLKVLNSFSVELEKVNAKNMELSLKIDSLQELLNTEKQHNAKLSKHIENLTAEKNKLANEINNGIDMDL